MTTALIILAVLLTGAAQLFGWTSLFYILVTCFCLCFISAAAVLIFNTVIFVRGTEVDQKERLKRFVGAGSSEREKGVLRDVLSNGITSKYLFTGYVYFFSISFWMWMSGFPFVAACSLFCLFSYLFFIDKMSHLYQNTISLQAIENEGE